MVLVAGLPCEADVLVCHQNVNHELWSSFHDDHQGAYGFRVGDSSEAKAGRLKLTTLVAGGWEFNPVAFAMWERRSGGWSLAGIARTVLLASLSGVEILELRPLDDQWIVVGRTAGGDGGDMWSSLWVGRWVLPNDFRVFVSVPEQLSSDGKPGTLDLDPDLVLTVERVLGVCSTQVVTESIPLRPLLDLLARGRTVLEAHRELGIFDNERDLRATLGCDGLDERDRARIESLLRSLPRELPRSSGKP